MKLVIEFNSTFELEFNLLLENRITRRWARKLKAAQRLGYPIDDPKRFYSFDSANKEAHKALTLINDCINTINSHDHIIDRHLLDINDQDTLNYLHHIFEVYHGLLDQQDHPYYLSAPDNVKKALADLNIYVHRCESIYRNRNPRLVLTWFGLPKKHTFEQSDYALFTNRYQFGTVYINYVEIGKNLLDYYKDDELGENAHAGEEAFKPFKFFSADCVIQFYDVDQDQADAERSAAYSYYKQHREFFDSKGYSIDDPCHAPGLLPVATLDTSKSNQEVLDLIRENQLVTKVYFK